jgi:hypothetical protein
MKTLISAVLLSTLLSGCSTIGKTVDNASHSSEGMTAAYGIAGQVGQEALGVAGFFGHIFSRGAPKADNCVNGLGQKLDCETGEVLPGQEKPKSE